MWSLPDSNSETGNTGKIIQKYLKSGWIYILKTASSSRCPSCPSWWPPQTLSWMPESQWYIPSLPSTFPNRRPLMHPTPLIRAPTPRPPTHPTATRRPPTSTPCSQSHLCSETHLRAMTWGTPWGQQMETIWWVGTGLLIWQWVNL